MSNSAINVETRAVEKIDAAPQHTRETVESVVIAIILAFLFRTFVAEAFVIPTGSMAPTLQGRHLDVECSKCGYEYRTGASVENPSPIRASGTVVAATCPICRYTMTLDREGDPNQRSFNGDRILVSKFTTEFDRWDVIVFKYPGNSKQNYIKRLVGMPGEVVMIRHGNIYTTPILFRSDPIEELFVDVDGMEDEDLTRHLAEQFEKNNLPISGNLELEEMGSEWYLHDRANNRTYILVPHDERLFICENKLEIVRKPTQKLLSMLQLTHDTRHRAPQLTEAGWPSRWQQWSANDGPAAWKIEDGERSFSLEPTDELTWLRYRHVVPRSEEWELIEEGKLPDRLENFPGQLITDYYPYNDGREYEGEFREPRGETAALGMHWVADLALEAEVEVQGESGELHLDLVAAGTHYTCVIDVATGQAKLQIDGGEGAFLAEGKSSETRVGQTSVQGPGTYDLRFSNVDHQLRLWVGNKVIEFDGPTTYDPENDELPKWSPRDSGDLEPLGIAGRKVGLKVERLKVLRDIYYVANSAWTITEHDYKDLRSAESIREVMSTPTKWDEADNLFADRRFLLFALDEDQYFPLGDNSPKSKDARLWSARDLPGNFPPPGPFVPEELLIGEALIIYWPHAWRRPIPFLPNVERMGLIH